VTLPEIFAPLGRVGRFDELRTRAETLYQEIRRTQPHAAAYALTNAHRRRVLFQCNLRELYHIVRLRLDRHAQWDIRALAGEMASQARERMPLATLLLTGRDRFEEAREQAFGGL
jgi:thymidylate synthase ThyX